MAREIGLIILLLGATSCAYLFGTFLNDWKDAQFDEKYRPERAIPSGRWSRRAIGSIALALAILATAFLVPLSLSSAIVPLLGAALLASIVCYTILHKKTPTAIIPMGLCRGLLYPLGFFGAANSSPGLIQSNHPLPMIILIGMGSLVYVAGLTLAARYESGPAGGTIPRLTLRLLLFGCLLTHNWWWISGKSGNLGGTSAFLSALPALAVFVLWTARSLSILRRSVPAFVSRSLAGICLVDLLAFPGITIMLQTSSASVISCPALLPCLPLSCMVLSLVLQRVAPAT
ncbi:MAG: UbiA family prenyltransferase [Roseibacillus sp.]|nr:UbiA family prenyltransferase [Roseibacillus sp.]